MTSVKQSNKNKKRALKELVEIEPEVKLESTFQKESFSKVFFIKDSKIEFETEPWNAQKLKVYERQFSSLRDKPTFCSKKINTVRWKKIQKRAEKNGNQDDEQNDIENSKDKIQTNSSIVEWDDGTYSLLIGTNVYPLQLEDYPGVLLKGEQEDNLYSVQGIVGKKINVATKQRTELNLD